MKSFIIAIGVSMLLTMSVSAQTRTDQRALSTKIADLLATIPEQNHAQLDKNMEQMISLGKEARMEMITMLAPEGKGDNTALEYALAGLSAYVMKKDREDQRRMLAAEYCAAMEKVSGDWNKEFIIRQLQLVGTNEQVPCLTAKLREPVLADAAARALSQIATPEAQAALLSEFTSSTDPKLRLSLIEALGYSKNKKAVAVLGPLASNEDKDVRKVALHALAEIADPASAQILEAQARKTSYRFDMSGATAAYLRYLQNLAAGGHKPEAERLTGTLMSQVKGSGSVQVRSAALAVFASINGDKSLPQLYKAMQDKNSQYRDAALDLAARYLSPVANKQWLKTLSSVSPEAQAQILEHLGNTGDASLLPGVAEFLKSKDTSVRKAAISAYAQLGNESAVPALIELAKSGSTQDIIAIKHALLVTKGNGVVTAIDRNIASMPVRAQAELLQVLAHRRAEEAAPRVIELTKSSDTMVHRAAMQALTAVAREQDLPALFEWMNNAAAADANFLQQALLTASEGMDTAQRAELFISQMNNAAAGKQPLYLKLLSATGGAAALEKVNQAYVSGNPETKLAAIEALSLSTDNNAPGILINISRSATDAALAKKALDAFLGRIGKAALPGEQKLLLLKEAMPLARDAAQKKSILSAVAGCQTFLALVFAGEYLDNSEINQQAAQAVISIALSDKTLAGSIVRSLLNKTIDVLKGSESEYQKQAIRKHLAEMPGDTGFVPLFNGKDLTGWQGLVGDPLKRAAMTPKQLAEEQKKADTKMRSGWEAKDRLLIFKGEGENLSTVKKYGDFEMLVDWKITRHGDAGIYLRGTPQVQIWDTSRVDVGAQVGSGGLYNNQKNPSKPLLVADNAVGEWNTFRIIMKGDRVTVYLNGKLVTDSVVLENYWDRKQPIFPSDYIELQAHGTYVAYRDIYIREISGSKKFELSEEEKKKGFEVLFDGTSLDKWVGNKTDYVIDNGELLVRSQGSGHGNLFTGKEYSDFVFRFEFQLTPGANNGLGIRAPLEGDAAYTGMELQILDNDADVYKNLKPYQYHGSVYGVATAKRGFLKAPGEWNYQEVTANGSKIKVVLNGETILDTDISDARKNGTLDGLAHPGLKNEKGHIGFLGHGSMLRFRNIRILDLKK